MKKISIMFVVLAAILAGGNVQAAGEYVDQWSQPNKEVATEKTLEDLSGRVPIVCIHGYTFFRNYSGNFPTPFPSTEKQEKCGGENK